MVAAGVMSSLGISSPFVESVDEVDWLGKRGSWGLGRGFMGLQKEGEG